MSTRWNELVTTEQKKKKWKWKVSFRWHSFEFEEKKEKKSLMDHSFHSSLFVFIAHFFNSPNISFLPRSQNLLSFISFMNLYYILMLFLRFDFAPKKKRIKTRRRDMSTSTNEPDDRSSLHHNHQHHRSTVHQHFIHSLAHFYLAKRLYHSVVHNIQTTCTHFIIFLAHELGLEQVEERNSCSSDVAPF